MCAMQGISLVVKIKTTSGKSVFCCFRASGGGSHYRHEVGRVCVCAVFAFPEGFGAISRTVRNLSGRLLWERDAPGAQRGSLGAPCGSRRSAPGPRRPQLPQGARLPEEPRSQTQLQEQPVRAAPRRSEIIWGRSVGGAYPVLSCGQNPPPALLGAEQGRCGENRRTHRELPQAVGRKGRRDRTGPARAPEAAPR